PQGLQLRPARAGPLRPRVLHGGQDELRRTLRIFGGRGRPPMPPLGSAGKAGARRRFVSEVMVACDTTCSDGPFSRAGMRRVGLTALLVIGLPAAATAGVVLPPGFTEQIYVTGQGFDRAAEPASPGVPVATTLGVDAAGHLYLARSGTRYGTGQVEE